MQNVFVFALALALVAGVAAVVVVKNETTYENGGVKYVKISYDNCSDVIYVGTKDNKTYYATESTPGCTNPANVTQHNGTHIIVTNRSNGAADSTNTGVVNALDGSSLGILMFVLASVFFIAA